MKDEIIDLLEQLLLYTSQQRCRIVGMHIHNIDNPGWYGIIKFNYDNGELQSNVIWNKIDKSETDWLHWRIFDNQFEFACSARSLSYALSIFLNHIMQIENLELNNKVLYCIEDWFAKCCNEDWEHSDVFSIFVLNDTWKIKIDFDDLIYPYEKFLSDEENNSKDNWYKYWLDNHVFHGESSPNNLHKLLEGFLSNIARFESN